MKKTKKKEKKEIPIRISRTSSTFQQKVSKILLYYPLPIFIGKKGTYFFDKSLSHGKLMLVNQLINRSRELQVVNHTIKNPLFPNLFFHNPNVIQFLTQDETSMC